MPSVAVMCTFLWQHHLKGKGINSDLSLNWEQEEDQQHESGFDEEQGREAVENPGGARSQGFTKALGENSKGTTCHLRSGRVKRK